MTPHKEWLHMDTVELEKLHWTQDLPPLRRQQTQEVRDQGGWGCCAPAQTWALRTSSAVPSCLLPALRK